jgi:hypothetical protein
MSAGGHDRTVCPRVIEKHLSVLDPAANDRNGLQTCTMKLEESAMSTQVKDEMRENLVQK